MKVTYQQGYWLAEFRNPVTGRKVLVESDKSLADLLLVQVPQYYGMDEVEILKNA